MKNKRAIIAATLLLPAAFMLIFFFVVPIGRTINTSLLHYDPVNIAVGPITLDNYLSFLGTGYYQGVLFRTLEIAFWATVSTLVIGYLVSLYMAKATSRTRSVLTVFLLAPLMVNVIALSYAWLVVLSPSGLINRLLLSVGLIHEPLKMMYTKGAVIVGLGYVFLPYMVLSIDAAMRLIDPRLELAAKSLGASSWIAFWKIRLPLSMPGVVSGSLMVFALSASSFITPALLGGSSNTVIANVLYDQTLVFFNAPLSSAIAIAFVFLNLILIGFYSHITRSRHSVAMGG